MLCVKEMDMMSVVQSNILIYFSNHIFPVALGAAPLFHKACSLAIREKHKAITS